jgi:hypothetical protein
MDSRQEWHREANMNDTWTYIWGSGIFTSKLAYEMMKGQMQASAPFQWLWKSRCQGKHKVFFWLLLNDHLNTRNLLHRKRFNIPMTNYIICIQGVEETMKHLFFECEFAQSCWTALHIVWDLSLVVDNMLIEGKWNFRNICYIEVIILAAWTIWIHRNNFIFNSEVISFARWKKEF